ncbi:MFS transporter [Endozoicomonas arenosclerae]|uniref:MFS transporter n=1 Tax=Endozoicomonas arenosclerae TaxID=1633495 RepID=UPI0007836C31|nr:MFS transporter [Endozoicomonas arenosclerae]
MSERFISKKHRQLVWVTSLGGFLEFYDFVIYALMASYLSDLFFPSHDPYTSLLTTFATFSVGYMARPLGGVIFGHFGDRFGRKPTFVITVLMMALSTALIGCLPTYNQIGLAAPLLLTLLRVFQGFSIGGEIPGAMTYLSETVDQRPGLVMGLLFLALVNGVVFGSLVEAFMLWWLTPEQMSSWGWRVPFWLGGTLGICSYVVRKRFNESRLFLELGEKQKRSRVPLAQLFSEHKLSMFCGTLLIIPVAVSMPLLFLFTPGYLTRLLEYDASQVAQAGAIGIFASSLVFLLVGSWCEKISRVRLMQAGSMIIVMAGWVIFPVYASGHAYLIAVMLLSALTMGSVVGVAPLLLSTLFPVEVRYSGIAFCYNLSFALFGGLAPLIAMSLIQGTGSLSSPAWYLSFSGLCGILGAALVTNKSCRTLCSQA